MSVNMLKNTHWKNTSKYKKTYSFKVFCNSYFEMIHRITTFHLQLMRFFTVHMLATSNRKEITTSKKTTLVSDNHLNLGSKLREQGS